MGDVLAASGLGLWLILLSGMDIRYRRLPNWLTLPGAVVILTVTTLGGRGAAALLGALGLFAVYAAVHLAAPRAMGAGDVKLAVGLGALTGAFGLDVWIVAAVGASVLTAVVAVWQLARGGAAAVPHGPSMCAAAALAVTIL